MNQLENAFFSQFTRKEKYNKMNRIKKALWFGTGVLLLFVAYLGVLIPGLPWSTPILGSAFCFAKSNERIHNWIMNNPRFGPFIKNWSQYRVYPTKAKYLMVTVMAISLLTIWFTTGNILAIYWTSGVMAAVIIWATRYPGSHEEAKRRIEAGEKIGWLK